MTFRETTRDFILIFVLPSSRTFIMSGMKTSIFLACMKDRVSVS